MQLQGVPTGSVEADTGIMGGKNRTTNTAASVVRGKHGIRISKVEAIDLLLLRQATNIVTTVVNQQPGSAGSNLVKVFF